MATRTRAAADISPPSIAMASTLFLVLGDMTAALVGVSFGGEVSAIKLGRTGKKSIEGSVAMFAVCFLVGAAAGVQSAPRAGSRTAPRETATNGSRRFVSRKKL